MEIKKSKLADFVDKNDPDNILNEVIKIFSYNYEKEDFSPVLKNYLKVKKIFEGKFPGYKACNTNYHDFNHTMDAFLCSMRLMDGYNICNINDGKIDLKSTINLLIAALFHDIGYIQETIDSEGTGAKYTLNHVLRSINFISRHYQSFEINYEDLAQLTNIIKCTGLSINLNTIPFSNEREKFIAMILGTGDILGQMSDREYLEKLLFLYYEFKEAKIPGYNAEFDIIKNTLGFYDEIMKRLKNVYNAEYNYAIYHFEKRYGVKENLYITAIENNMNYIKEILADDKTNFRKKLKRGKFKDAVLA